NGYCCSGVLAPFSINGDATEVVNQVIGYPGFQLADVRSGRVVASVASVGTAGSAGHGIAWTPDERQVWVNDGGNPYVHVFDMTTRPPQQVRLVAVSNSSPHWIAFTIDGRFAYVAGQKGSGQRTDVISTATYARVATLGPSEDLLEVDVRGGTVVAVGNQ